MLLGLVNAILVIHFIEVAPSSTNLSVISSPAIGFGVLLIPLMDTLRVFCIRIYNGRSPFSADRNHIHHLFLDRGFSHRSTTLIIAGLSVAFSIFSFSIASAQSTLIIFMQTCVFFLTIYLVYLIKPSSVLVVQNDKGNVTIEEKKKPLLISIFHKKEQAAAIGGE
jgi:hypothetical protein